MKMDSLFDEDRDKLLPLPKTPFDPATYMSACADKYGFFKLENGKHIYSSSPAAAQGTVRLKITSSTVVVMDKRNEVVTTHRRIYSRLDDNGKPIDEKITSIKWLPYFSYISHHPNSFRNTGIRDMMPKRLVRFIDSLDNGDRGKVLQALHGQTEKAGLDKACDMLLEVLEHEGDDMDRILEAYGRRSAEEERRPAGEEVGGTPPGQEKKELAQMAREDIEMFGAMFDRRDT